MPTPTLLRTSPRISKQVHAKATKVYKGVHSFVESYSSFYDTGKQAETSLARELKASGVTDIFVCGLATDVCVGEGD